MGASIDATGIMTIFQNQNQGLPKTVKRSVEEGRFSLCGVLGSPLTIFDLEEKIMVDISEYLVWNIVKS